MAAQRCGYSEDLATFEQELKKAGDHIGVEISSFNDLTKNQLKSDSGLGIEVAPESSTQL